MLLSLIVSAITYGCATFLALELAKWLTVKDGGDTTVRQSEQNITIIRSVLVAAAATMGGLLASYFVPWLIFGSTGIVCVCLCMAVYSEMLYGRVPDVILLVPLGTLVLLAIYEQQWGTLEAAALLPIPFIVLGLMSKGKGVARADAEIAAVAGGLLGLQFGLVAFGVGILTAFFVNVRQRDGKTQVQLTPYLAASIVLAVVVRLMVPTSVM